MHTCKKDGTCKTCELIDKIIFSIEHYGTVRTLSDWYESESVDVQLAVIQEFDSETMIRLWNSSTEEFKSALINQWGKAALIRQWDLDKYFRNLY